MCVFCWKQMTRSSTAPHCHPPFFGNIFSKFLSIVTFSCLHQSLERENLSCWAEKIDIKRESIELQWAVRAWSSFWQVQLLRSVEAFGRFLHSLSPNNYENQLDVNEKIIESLKLYDYCMDSNSRSYKYSFSIHKSHTSKPREKSGIPLSFQEIPIWAKKWNDGVM